jgi:hypothetical protein
VHKKSVHVVEYLDQNVRRTKKIENIHYDRLECRLHKKFFPSTISNMNSFLKKISVVVLPILSVYVIHYFAAKLYVRFCAEFGILGFFKSMLTTGSPVCTSLLSILNSTQNSYTLLLTSMVSGFLLYVTTPRSCPLFSLN